jgi:hypothetical protein
MNKKLIYEHAEGIAREKNYAMQVELNLNKALDVFHSLQSFAKIETEKEAMTFAENPLNFFDRLMLEATNVKPIGSVPLNPESIATMYGINRQGFISACVAKMPGADTYQIQQYPIKMTPRDRAIVRFKDGRFVINQEALEQRIEQNKVYAETPTQLEILEYWETLCNILNNHIEKGFVNKFEIYKTSRALGLISQNDKFAVDYAKLAHSIKKAS